MNPFLRKSMSTLVIQPSFRALGQMQVKWQTFEKPEMYGSQAWVDPLPYICLLFSGFSNVCHSAAFWPTALKLGCITYFNMLSLVMGFISLVHEIQFMPIYLMLRVNFHHWYATKLTRALPRKLKNNMLSIHTSKLHFLMALQWSIAWVKTTGFLGLSYFSTNSDRAMLL